MNCFGLVSVCFQTKPLFFPFALLLFCPVTIIISLGDARSDLLEILVPCEEHNQRAHP